MSFARESRCLCTVTDLDLFASHMVQQSIESTKTHYYRPLSTVEGAEIIEFILPPSEDYTSLSETLLEVRAKVVKVDAAGKESALTPAEAKRVSPEKLFLHCLFSQVDLTIGERVVTPSLTTYPFAAYLQTLLSFGSDAKNSFLTAEGWLGGACTNAVDTVRSSMLTDGEAHLLGRPHLDLFQQQHLILPHVDIKLRLLKAPDAFALMHTPATPAEKLDVKVKITECLLLVKNVTVNDDIILAHEKALERSPARYPLRRSLVRFFPLPGTSLSATVDNITGEIPSLLIVGLVPSEACHGRLNLSPFAFEPQGVTRLGIFVNGSPKPIHPFKPSFDTGSWVRSYLSLFQATSNYLSNDGVPSISYKGYVDENCVLWAVNLSQDDSAGDTHINPTRHGTLRLEFTFKKALTQALTVVAYMEFDNEMTISATREVSIDF